MQYISDILALLDKIGNSYTFIGDRTRTLTGFSDPGDYRPNSAIWLGDVKYLKLKEGQSYSDVTLLFCTQSMEGKEKFSNIVMCDDPRNTFMEVVELIVGTADQMPEVASTAVISPKAIIGEGVSIGHYSVIEDGVEIGAGTKIGCGTIIHSGSKMGCNCVIMDHVAIGNPGFGFRKLPNGSHNRLPHIGRVIIGDNVEIGCRCNIDKGTFRDTIIHNGVKIDSNSFIAHNVEIGEDSMVIACTIGGNCKIGARAELIGMRCKNRLLIGEDVKIGIGSVVISDVPAGVTVFGNPARAINRTNYE